MDKKEKLFNQDKIDEAFFTLLIIRQQFEIMPLIELMSTGVSIDEARKILQLNSFQDHIARLINRNLFEKYKKGNKKQSARGKRNGKR